MLTVIHIYVPTFNNLLNKLNMSKRDILSLIIATVVCNSSKRGKYTETDGNLCSYSVKIFMRSHDKQKDVTKKQPCSNDLFGFANTICFHRLTFLIDRYIFDKNGVCCFTFFNIIFRRSSFWINVRDMVPRNLSIFSRIFLLPSNVPPACR
jgi:hypothetical protein